MTTQMSGEELLNIMNGFKATITKTMEDIGQDINRKIDDKLNRIDRGLDNLTDEVRTNDKKQESNHRNLEQRLKKLEIDTERARYSRMKQNSELSNNFQSDGRRQIEKEREKVKKTEVSRFVIPDQEHITPLGPERDPLSPDVAPPISRTSSWAEEVESEASGTRTEDDRRQWTQNKRIPNSTWADTLNGHIREAAGQLGPTRRPSPTLDRGQRLPKPREDKEGKHHCKSFNPVTVNHWFGESSQESQSDSTEDDNEEWQTIDREAINRRRRQRTKLRRSKRMTEVAGKARCMAGVGPILDSEINEQLKSTRNYSEAKCWAIKDHLMKYYSYNQRELDDLQILETKRAKKDDIIYFAVKSEDDIRDIYQRKAECRQDDTTIKMFIPPHYFDRFTTLNRICREKRESNPELKTQIRFGTNDLIILVKQKGSEDPFRIVELRDFTENQDIPPFDMTVKWRIQEDRIPRRRVGSSQAPAKRQETTRQAALPHQTTRQLSNTSEPDRRKRQKTDDTEVEETETPTIRKDNEVAEDVDMTL